jgi:hypothetical protein
MMGPPPVSEGTLQLSDKLPSAADMPVIAGAAAGPNGIRGWEANDHVTPFAFSAPTRNTYLVPSIRPLTVAGEAEAETPTLGSHVAPSSTEYWTK